MPTVTVIQPQITEISPVILRSAAYCRVSSGSEDQLNSYAAQVRYYGQKLEASETETLVDIYADEGITGTSADKRDEFKRMIRDCRKGKIDRVYTKSISRFARNTKDCLKYVRELKSLGISIVFEKENIDTLRTSDEMIITVLGGLAQEESVSISQNLQWSIRKRMQNGTFNAASLPYGYSRINGEVCINENEAVIVEYIFDSYISGSGMESIANELNKSINKNEKGFIWCKNTVRYILTNEKYTGTAIYQKYYTLNVFPFRQKENKGEINRYMVEDAMPVLISLEKFNLVQEIYKKRLDGSKRTKGGIYPLSGKMICGNCSASYKRRIINGNVCWGCSTHTISAEKCKFMPLKESEVYNSFISMCNKLQQNYKQILLPLHMSLQELNAKRFYGNTAVLDIHKEIAALKEQKHVIARLRTKGFMDEQKYTEQSAVLDNKIAKKQKELSRKSKAEYEDEVIGQIEIITDFFEKRTKIMSEFEESAFELLTDKIVVRKNCLEFHLIGGLKFTEEI